MMISRAMRNIHRAQDGFTLIEVLVVMTILGILAAIVSISLLGITANARTKARDTEKATVQAAWDAMLSDQQVPVSDLAGYCDSTYDTTQTPPAVTLGTTTSDMSKFPGTGSKAGAPDNDYAAPGQLLPVHLATHYLRQLQSKFKYGCTAKGDIVQTGP
jgi:prepilin-type N-terminal cleavage/methylation domain-containing protein